MITPTALERILVGQLFINVKEEIRERHVVQLLAEYRDSILRQFIAEKLEPCLLAELQKLDVGTDVDP